MIYNFNNLKFEYQRSIDNSFFNQEFEYFTFDIGLTNDKDYIDKYNELMKDTDFHINAQKMGLDTKTILDPNGKLSFVNLRIKMDLIKLLIMSDKSLEIKIRDTVNKICKDEDMDAKNIDDPLTLLSINNKTAFTEILTLIITKLISFGIPSQNILMVKADSLLIDASDGTTFDIQEFIDKVKNGDFSDFDPSDFLGDVDNDSGVLRININDLLNGLAKKGHYIKHEINIMVVLNRFIEQTKETCMEYMSKMMKIEERISDHIIKNVTLSLGLEKGKINLESIINNIQEILYESQLKTDPTIRFVQDQESLNLMDIVLQSDECIMKQELKDVTDSIGFAYIDKQLAIGSTLFVRGIYVPNRINKYNPFENIDITNFSKNGCFYIILERHPGNGEVLRKVFNGKYHGIAQTVSNFIVKNESILMKSV